MSRDHHRPFRNLRLPRAPAGLRERTLIAARATAGAGEPADTGHRSGRRLTDLLWESRPLRLAWALALVALIGVDLYLGREPAGAPEDRAASASRAPAGSEPRTLLASRGEVLEILLGREPDRRDEPPTTHRPRRTS